MSLLIGSELFQVPVRSLKHSHQYLVAHQKQSGLYQIQARFAETIDFQVAGTKSMTHKKLTATIAATHKKEVRARLIVVEEDPEKLKSRIEKEMNDKVKMHRKATGVRRRRNIGEELEDSDDEHYHRGNRDIADRVAGYDEYEADGESFLEGLTISDFVVADEDVEEERDKRILNAKSLSKRKAKKLSSESEASASNSEEERPKKRSKKVAITSDEDD
jgi:RNA polymerase-associated protein LEO1